MKALLALFALPLALSAPCIRPGSHPDPPGNLARCVQYNLCSPAALCSNTKHQSIYATVLSKGSETYIAVNAGPLKPCEVMIKQDSINSLTTVAAAYSFAGMLFPEQKFPIDPERISAYLYADAVEVAFGLYSRMVSEAGEVTEDFGSSPNGMETNSLAIFNSLANILQNGSTIQSGQSPLEQLAMVVWEPDGVNWNKTQLYELALHVPNTWKPSIVNIQLSLKNPTKVPTTWIVALVTNAIGPDKEAFGGPARVVWDAKHRGWIANNVFQGQGDSADNVVVLESNGLASSISPVRGYGLFGGAYGIGGPDKDGNVWVPNYGWGTNLPQNGSVSIISSEGETAGTSEYPDGTNNGPLYRVQGTQVDKKNNVWLCSSFNANLVVYINGDPENFVNHYTYVNPYPPPLPLYHPVNISDPGVLPFSVDFDSLGNAYVSTAGDSLPPYAQVSNGSLQKFRLVGKQLQRVKFIHGPPGCVPRGVTVTGDDRILWTCLGLDSVFEYTTDLVKVKDYIGMNWPWGLEADFRNPATRSLNRAWVAGFGLVSRTGVPDVYGASAETSLNKFYEWQNLTGPGLALLDGTKVRKFQVQSGGEPLRLPSRKPVIVQNHSNGTEVFELSYKPMQRATSANADSYGNIWFLNNWKAESWLYYQDPGGTSVMIFVGLAAVNPCSIDSSVCTSASTRQRSGTSTVIPWPF